MVTLFVVAGLPVAAVVWLVIGPVVTVLPVGPDRLVLIYGCAGARWPFSG